MTVFSSATKESAKMTKDFAANDLKSAANNAANSVERATDRSSRKTVDQLSDYANDAGRKMRRFFDDAGNELHHVSDRVTSEIREKPVRSSLIALAVGFVVGALVRR